MRSIPLHCRLPSATPLFLTYIAFLFPCRNSEAAVGLCVTEEYSSGRLRRLHCSYSYSAAGLSFCIPVSLSVPPFGSCGPHLPFCTMAMQALGLGLAWPDRPQLAKAELQELHHLTPCAARHFGATSKKRGRGLLKCGRCEGGCRRMQRTAACSQLEPPEIVHTTRCPLARVD
eukprot:364316-Chlamydomonas_euryale.AAC.6